MKNENPNEIACVIKQVKGGYNVFAIAPSFFRAQEGAPMPRRVMDQNSVFNLTMISGGTSVVANLKPEELAFLTEQLRICMQLRMEYKLMPKEENDKTNSLAYTEGIRLSPFNGKTAAEYLVSPEMDEQAVNTCYSMLKKNLGKYPKNQRVMDAIAEGVKALKAGTLQTAAPTVSLFEEPILMREKSWKKTFDGKEKSLVYDLDITFNVTQDKPLAITIVNRYASKCVYQDGKQNFNLKDASDFKSRSMSFSTQELYKILYFTDKYTDAYYKQNFVRGETLAVNALKAKKQAFLDSQEKRA